MDVFIKYKKYNRKFLLNLKVYLYFLAKDRHVETMVRKVEETDDGNVENMKTSIETSLKCPSFSSAHLVGFTPPTSKIYKNNLDVQNIKFNGY